MNKFSVCLLGCGYVLSRLAKQLDPATTLLVSRSPDKLVEYQQLGFSVFGLDIQNHQETQDFLSEYQFDTLIDSIPPFFTDATRDAKVATDHHRKFIQLLGSQEIQRVIYLSTTGVYGEQQGRVVSEDTPLNPQSEKAKARVVTEEAYRASGLNQIILRLPAISGPERNPKDSFMAGRYPYIDHGSRYTNRIHVEDLVEILKQLVSRTDSLPSIINVSDGSNLKTSELLAALQKKYPEISTPASIDKQTAKTKGYHTLLSNQQVSNKLLLATLGDIIKYKSPDWM